MRLWVLALLFVPLASASTEPAIGIWNPTDSTPVDLWLHCVDARMDCPVNTQMPQDRYTQAPTLGMPTHSQGCEEIEQVGMFSSTHHTYYAWSSPSIVDYEIDEGGKPRYHPGRGLGYDVALDLGVQPNFHFYVQVDGFGGGGTNENVPIVAPLVRVMTTWRTGDDITVSHEEMNAGEIIAQGTSEAVTLSPFVDHPQVTHENVAGKHVYGFHFQLAFTGKPDITADESFNLRTDVYIDLPVCNDPANDEYVMPGTVTRHAGGGLYPRLQTSILNPIRIEHIIPQFVGNDLVIHAQMMSPWGSYDVRNVTLDIQGPDAATSLELVQFVQRMHEWDHYTEPVNAAWVWDYGADRAGGAYEVRVQAGNLQANAVAHAMTTFDLGAGDGVQCHFDSEPTCFHIKADQQSQAVPWGAGPAVLLSLMALGLVRHRNKS